MLITISKAWFTFNIKCESDRNQRQLKLSQLLLIILSILILTLSPSVERPTRRVLRPRTEPKSYAEVPDIVLLPTKMNGRQQNGGYVDSETDDELPPPIIPIKELTAAEIWERERDLRKLREELRNEETKLVLLKKIKQSQHAIKENLIVQPTIPTVQQPPNTSNNQTLSVLPSNHKVPSIGIGQSTVTPIPAHSKNRYPPTNIRYVAKNYGFFLLLINHISS